MTTHTILQRLFHSHQQKRSFAEISLNKQRNKYLHHSPQASRAEHPTEQCCYFKAPKWLGCSGAVRMLWTCFSSSCSLGATHSFLCSGNHCIYFIPSRVGQGAVEFVPRSPSTHIDVPRRSRMPPRASSKESGGKWTPHS